MPYRTSRIALFATAVIAACRTAPHDAPRPTSGEHDVVTREELAKIVGATQNAYSAVERLRPLFLVGRPGFGTSDRMSPRVYVFINGYFAGEVDLLKTVPVASVESIRRVQGITAFTQLGAMHSGDGVLLVRLRR